MSILLRNEILEGVHNGQIRIDPFNEKFVGPNSVDVTLHPVLKTYEPVKIVRNDKGILQIVHYGETLFDTPLDVAKENKTYDLIIPDEGLMLLPGMLYLGSTNEAAGSEYSVPMYDGRSSMGRLGIQSHISAGFGDIGFTTNWTLEIIVIHPVIIYPNTRIGQVYFLKVDPDSAQNLRDTGMIYENGKYSNQVSAQSSKSHLDFTTSNGMPMHNHCR